MFESHVVASIDRTSFDFQFEDFLSNLPLWTIIYCVTDQPSITWSWRSVLNFKILNLIFSRLMSCLMSNEQKMCEVKMFQLKYMLNATRCINQRFAFKNSGIVCLALIFNLSYLRTTILQPKAVPGCEALKLIYCSFLQTNTNPWLSS